MESDFPMDPYELMKANDLAWERWGERAEAAFEDEFMETIQTEISEEMRDMLLEAFKAGALWGEQQR